MFNFGTQQQSVPGQASGFAPSFGTGIDPNAAAFSQANANTTGLFGLAPQQSVMPQGISNNTNSVNSIFGLAPTNLANVNNVDSQFGITEPQVSASVVPGAQVNPQVQASAPSMSTGQMLNFGLGAASTAAGLYYQNKQLDQSQQALDLNKEKYSDSRSDLAALRAANKERAATSAAQQASF